MKFIILLVPLIVLVQTQNIEIRCNFYVFNYNYNCNGSVVITQSDTPNVTFGGNHHPGRTNNNVVGVVLLNYTLEVLLSEIFTTFPNTVRGGFSMIRNNTFSDARNLESLYIYESTFKVLPPLAFGGAEKLTWIHIYDCNIQEVDENAFRSMEKLVYLMISQSKLRYLPQDVFRPLNSLQSILLQNGGIETIPTSLFANNYMLTDIWLSNNNITSISRNFVDHLRIRGLQRLDLADNICTNTTLTSVKLQWKEIYLALEPCYRNYENAQDICQQYCSQQCNQ